MADWYLTGEGVWELVVGLVSVVDWVQVWCPYGPLAVEVTHVLTGVASVADEARRLQ